MYIVVGWATEYNDETYDVFDGEVINNNKYYLSKEEAQKEADRLNNLFDIGVPIYSFGVSTKDLNIPKNKYYYSDLTTEEKNRVLAQATRLPYTVKQLSKN